MKLSIKYVIASWKKKTGGQIISFVYVIPLLLFIFCLLMVLLLPTTSNVIFYSNASYEYRYQIPCLTFSAEERVIVPNEAAYSLLQDKDRNALLYVDSAIVSAGLDEVMSEIGLTEYDKRSAIRLYVAREDTDLRNTIFVRENFTGRSSPYSKKCGGTPQLYVAHNTLKYLKSGIGDTVAIDFDLQQSFAVECELSGLLKPDYNGSNNESITEYDQYSDFIALMVVDEELFYKIAGNDLCGAMTVVYSNDKMDFPHSEAETVIEESREERMEMFKSAFSGSEFLTKAILQAAFSFIVMLAVLEMEYGFTRRRHESDLNVFAMLGMRRKDIRRTVLFQVLSKFLISAAAAVLLCKFVYFGFIMDMYCEPLLLLLIAVSFVIIGMAYTAVRIMFIRKSA